MRGPIFSKGIPFGWRDVWWRHFRWKGPNRADIAQLPVAMVLVLLYYILYYYSSKKKARSKWRHFRWCHFRFPVTWLTSQVTSLPVTHAQWSDPFDLPQILLCACWYTTHLGSGYFFFNFINKMGIYNVYEPVWHRVDILGKWGIVHKIHKGVYFTTKHIKWVHVRCRCTFHW